MVSNPRISQLLVETQAYRDLPQPVILTSGELGIYYINTEKLVQDGGEWEKVGDNSQAMISHAIRMMCEHPTFGEVIDILKERSIELLRSNPSPLRAGTRYAISGGQRRDWLFSGPVARQLNLPHLSIYKDGKIEAIDECGNIADSGLIRVVALHISDLLTEASSCYRVEAGEEKGWVPTLRSEGVHVRDLLAVVTRGQGGERNLAHHGVYAEAMVSIDEDFLRQYSENPERAVAYLRDPKEWSGRYLRENGALALLPAFDPQRQKDDRATKFLQRYGAVLKDAGKWEELDNAVREKYSQHL